MAIDESNFQRMLANFPLIRPRDYIPDEDSGQSTARSAWAKAARKRQAAKARDSITHPNDPHAAFWGKLKSSAEKKLGSSEAEAFCKAFQKVYRTVVYEELSVEAAKSFVDSP